MPHHLQRKETKEYHDLFSFSDVVYSAPMQFTWVGGFAVYHGALCMAQKLPMRCYVGISLDEEKTHIASYSAYVPFQEKHESHTLPDHIDEHCGELLEQFLEEEIHGYKGEHFSIRVLSDYDWIDTNSLALSLACCLMTYYEELHVDFMSTWHKLHYQELYRHPLFEKVYRFAWKLSIVLSNGRNQGTCGGVITAMIPTPSPILYQIEKNTIFARKHLTKEALLAFASNARYMVVPIEELEPEQKFRWPIDFMILYPGYKKIHDWNETYHAHREKSSVEKYLLEEKRFQPKDVNYIHDNDLDHMVGAMHVQSSHAIDAFISATNGGSLKRYIAKLKQYYALYNVFCFDRNPEYASGSMALMKQICHSMVDDPEQLFLVDRLIMRDHKILVACKKGAFSTSYEKLVSRMKKEVHEDVVLEYASWRDGVEKGSLRLELYKKSGYGRTKAKHNYLLQEIDGEHVYVDRQQLDILMKNYDICFDVEQKKLYMQGKKLTSKDLLSQSFTTDVLQAIFQSEKRAVANVALPNSSYSESKNDMEQKIVSPLIRKIENALNKEFPLQVVGASDDFYITLGEHKLKVASFRKLIG